MPYSGIRASFCLKGLGIKRLSNGIIEKVWQTKKNKNPAQFPANYISNTLKSTRGQALKVDKW